jgi:hypothetical protein
VGDPARLDEREDDREDERLDARLETRLLERDVAREDERDAAGEGATDAEREAARELVLSAKGLGCVGCPVSAAGAFFSAMAAAFCMAAKATSSLQRTLGLPAVRKLSSCGCVRGLVLRTGSKASASSGA